MLKISNIKIFFSSFLLFLLFFNSSEGQSEEVITKKKNNSFQVGEKLTFSIGYEFIPAGKSVLSVDGISELNGRSVYRITSRTRSHRFFDPFFKVRDEITTYIDTETLQSIKFRKKLREGSYSYDYSVDFNPDSMTAVSTSPKGTRIVEIPEFTLDVLSAMYYMRTLDMKVGKTLTLTILDNDKLYPMDIRILRRERISTRAGTFDCLVIIPELQSGGLFKNEGRITAWVTDDHRKIPVLMKSKAIIGAIIVELQEVEGLVD